MANYLVTGSRNNTPHITSMDDASFNAGVLGEEVCILDHGEKMRAEAVSSNLVRIFDGDLVAQGRHIRIENGDYADLAIGNGVSDVNRNDIVVARYNKDAGTGVESVDFAVIQGTPAPGAPTDPSHTHGNISDGALVAEFPMYRVLVRGTSIAGIERIAHVGGQITADGIDVGDPDAIGDNYFRVRVKNKSGREIDLASAASGNIGLYNNASGHFIIYADNNNAVNVGTSSDSVNVNGTMTAKKAANFNSTLNVSGTATVGGKLSANGGVDVTGAVNAGSANTSGSIVAGSAERTSATSVRVVNQNSSVGIIASTNSAGEGGVYDYTHDKFIIAVDTDGKVRIPSHSTTNLTAENISAVSDSTAGTNKIDVGNAVEVISLVANATNNRAGVYSDTHGKYLIRVNADGSVELPSAVESIHVNGTSTLDGTVRIGNVTTGNVYASLGNSDSHFDAQLTTRSNAGAIALLSNYAGRKYGLFDVTNNKWLLSVDRDGIVYVPSHETATLTVGTVNGTGTIRTTGNMSAAGEQDNYITAGGDDNPYSAFVRARSKNGGEVDIRSSNVYSKAGLYSGEKERYIIDIPKTGGVTAKVENVNSSASLALCKDGGESGNNALSFDSYTSGTSTLHRLRPSSNGVVNLGSANSKWNTLYAATGTINTSDRNAKESIEELDGDKMVDFVMGLNPVSYRYKDGTSGRTHFGMVAQDVEQNMTDNGMSDTDFAGFCRDDINGESIYGLRYDEFIAPLIKVVQEQQKKIEELSAKIEELKK